MSTIELAAGEGSSNPILPNGTFIVEAIIFGIVLLLFWRFIVPPIRKAMSERHDRAQKTIDDNNAATQKYREAEQRLHDALHDARTESVRIRDEARAEGQRILDEMRQQANEESARIQQRGADELAAERERVVSDLDARLGEFSTTLASRVVGEDVSVAAGYRGEIDGFLREVGGGSAEGRAST